MLKTQSDFEDILRRDRRRVSQGTILKSEGDESHLRYYVVEGWLTVFKSLENGERQILEFVLPVESYDPTGADGHTSFVQIEALGDATIVTIDKTKWARLLDNDPELRSSERLRDIAQQARQSERMLRLGKSSAETRIAYVLIELCMRLSGVGGNYDCAFHVPLCQQQLGDFIGLSSVHVCRTMRRLSRQGLITTSDHMDIAIHDVPALASLAGVDPKALRDEIIPGAA